MPPSLLQTLVDPMLDMPTRHLLLNEIDAARAAADDNSGTSIDLSLEMQADELSVAATLAPALPAATLPVAAPPVAAKPATAPPASTLPIRLNAPRNWYEEEGTAAIMLPDRPHLPPPQARVAPPEIAPTPVRSWGQNLLMAALGGLFVLVVLFVVGRFTGAVRFGATIAAPQQLIIDEALFAVQTGRLTQAIGILERLQREQAAPDPMIDAMVVALKKRLR